MNPIMDDTQAELDLSNSLVTTYESNTKSIISCNQ